MVKCARNYECKAISQYQYCDPALLMCESCELWLCNPHRNQMEMCEELCSEYLMQKAPLTTITTYKTPTISPPNISATSSNSQQLNPNFLLPGVIILLSILIMLVIVVFVIVMVISKRKKRKPVTIVVQNDELLDNSETHIDETVEHDEKNDTYNPPYSRPSTSAEVHLSMGGQSSLNRTEITLYDKTLRQGTVDEIASPSKSQCYEKSNDNMDIKLSIEESNGEHHKNAHESQCTINSKHYDTTSFISQPVSDTKVVSRKNSAKKSESPYKQVKNNSVVDNTDNTQVKIPTINDNGETPLLSPEEDNAALCRSVNDRRSINIENLGAVAGAEGNTSPREDSYEKMKHIFKVLKKLPYVEGYFSEGRSINIFADLNVLEKSWVLEQVKHETDQPTGLFTVKHSTELE